MPKGITSIIKYILSIGVTVVLLWLVFKDIDFKKIIHGLKEANFTWVVLSLLISLIGHVSRVIRWKLIMEPLNYFPKLSNAFMALMSGYFMNLTIPRLGEITRCVVLQRTEKIPVDTSLGTVIAERLMDVLVLLLLLIIGVLIEFERLHQFFFELAVDKLTVFKLYGYTILIVLGILIAIIISIYIAFKEQIKKSKLFDRILKVSKNVIAGILSVRKIKKPFLFIFHTLVIWSTYFFSSYVVFFAFPQTMNLPLSAGFTILIMGTISMAAPVQGGTGVFHVLVSSVLILYGLTREEGMIYATLLHFSQYVFMLLSGAICFALSFIKNKKYVPSHLT